MSNILNQDEINSLLGAMERGESIENKEASDLQINEYNFRRPNLITREQLRAFETVHEVFARELVSSLALLLRTNIDFSLISTEQQQYTEFISGLPKISHCIVFSANPFPGHIAIEINLSLVFAIVDILLGGEGDIETEIRMPTDIEGSILSPLIERLTEHLQEAWGSYFEIKFEEERTESDPEYIQVSSPDVPVIVHGFDTKINMINGIINICYPLSTIQAINEALSKSGVVTEDYIVGKKDEHVPEKLMAALLEIPLPLSVDLGISRSAAINFSGTCSSFLPTI
jgi:flagellar motor switch protein FliM